ncbi:Coiled-coil and C2 domain-containing protein 1B [Actinomortierella ambigua]|nr:Coiled-coil and C2 domain-containing protein 1B [Actinomortierella ambigua]
MFSWKKDPSQIRRPSPAAGNDYADLISQSLRLANEDLPEGGEGDYLDDEEVGDVDLDDPDLLAELHGLTGEGPAPKPRAAATTAKTPKPTASAVKASPATTAGNNNAAAASKAPPNPILADLGLSEADFEDNEDSEVELTEEDMKNPQFLAQLRSLGGIDESDLGGSDTHGNTSLPPNKDVEPSADQKHQSLQSAPPKEHHSQTQSDQTQPERMDSDNHSLRRPGSTSSSLIAIPPRDRPYEYEDDDMASVSDLPVEKTTATKEPPKQDRQQLLNLLRVRETQYKLSALECKRANDLTSAGERVKTLKKIREWIKLVDAGGFLDPDLYTIPDEPPSSAALKAPSPSSSPSCPSTENPASPTTPPASSSQRMEAIDAPTTSRPRQLDISVSASSSKVYEPPMVMPVSASTTQVSMELAAATGDDVRHEHTSRRTVQGGIEFRRLAKDDDFQIISSNDDDTYDMLQSQLESQIEMCKRVKRYYFQNADKMTALKFHKHQNIFEADLMSLKSYRQHGKKAPAFHFQDVRFEVEVGFNPDIALSEVMLTVKRCWDLSHKDVAPNNIVSYVDWNFGWPTENMAGAGTGKGYTNTVKQTSSPEYHFTQKIGIERTRSFQNFVQRRKATFEVWHYRGMFRKSLPLGRAQVSLQSLLHHSEIHEVLPLMDPMNSRKPTGGKIEIEIKLQRPLLKPEIAVKEEKWLVIDEFNSSGLDLPALGGSASPSSSSAASQGRVAAARKQAAAAPASAAVSTPSPASSASPRVAAVNSPVVASPKVAQTPPQPAAAPKPAQRPAAQTLDNRIGGDGDEEPADAELAKAKAEFESVDLLVSNNVLESEIEMAKQGIQAATAAGKTEEADGYQDRLMQLEVKMQLLVAQVQSGLLTMDQYCTKVKARMEKDKALALFFKKRQMLPEAKKALARFKIMQAEMKEVEEALAAEDGGGEGDE